MSQVWFILGCSVVGALLIVLLVHLVARARRREAPPPEEPLPYDEEFDRKTVTAALDWYILRHLQDQERMPRSQVFLDEDRERNALLNRYALHQLAKQGLSLPPVGSTKKDSVRPADASQYLPRYFPDDEMDSALVMFKHELIANRLIDTIAYLHRIRDSKAQPLPAFSELRADNTPFVPEAYVTFYNDLVQQAGGFDHEDGLREKIRVLAVRMIFPAKQPEFNYWRDRGVDIFQVPTPVARDAVSGWFGMKPSDIPLASAPKQAPPPRGATST